MAVSAREPREYTGYHVSKRWVDWLVQLVAWKEMLDVVARLCNLAYPVRLNDRR
jgi:hypothetical protein